MDASVIVVGIVIGSIILINPFIGLIAIVALIPQSLFPSLGYMLFGIFTVATPIKIIGGFTFIPSFMRHVFQGKKWDFLKKPQIKFFGLFLLWIYISGFTHPCSFTRESFTVFTSFALLGFIILSLVSDIKKFRLVLWAGLISIFIVVLNTVLSYSSFNYVMRMKGAAYGPNYFAIGLLPFLGIAFYNSFVQKKKLLKVFSLVISISIICALMVTFSRAGFVGLLGMLLIAAFKAKKKIKAFLLLILVVILLINTMPAHVWDRFIGTKATLENLENTSNVDNTKRRFLLARAAWKMFLDHPLSGVGIGNYYYESREYEPIHAGRAHTMYLEIMAELGLVGIFLFLGILFFTLKGLKKIMKTNTIYSNYAYGFYIGLVGLLIAALFFHAQQEKILWFVIFMAAALENIVSKEKLKAKI